MQTESTVKSQLEKFVDLVALHLAGEPDAKMIATVKMMKLNLPDSLARYDLGHDVTQLSDLLITNIVATREEIHLGAGQMSRTLH